jgi:hypothetical protein
LLLQVSLPWHAEVGVLEKEVQEVVLRIDWRMMGAVAVVRRRQWCWCWWWD